MILSHRSKLYHSLDVFRHVQSSSWIHGLGLIDDRLMVLFEYPNGSYRSYVYPQHGIGSYVVLSRAFSVGTAFKNLDLKHHDCERHDGSLAFFRPFQVFESVDIWHESLSVSVDVKIKLNSEGSFHNYRTLVDIRGECNYKYFTEEYHGKCRYDIGVYLADEILAEFSLTPVEEGLEDNFKDKIDVFKGELYGDIEVQVDRVTLI